MLHVNYISRKKVWHLGLPPPGSLPQPGPLSPPSLGLCAPPHPTPTPATGLKITEGFWLSIIITTAQGVVSLEQAMVRMWPLTAGFPGHGRSLALL